MNGEVIQVYSSLGMSNILMLRYWPEVVQFRDSHIGWCETDLGSKFPKNKFFKGHFIWNRSLVFVGIHLYLPWAAGLGMGRLGDDSAISGKRSKATCEATLGERFRWCHCHTLEGSGNVPWQKLDGKPFGETRKIKWCASFFWEMALWMVQSQHLKQ